jgi:hypothetical protein
MNEAFVYKWTNTENEMYYIGKHKGTEYDGYISSGRYFLYSYYTNPKIFTREILFKGSDKQSLEVETALINNAIKNDGYSKIYNLTTWHHLRRWSRRCLVCNAVCCPENTQWAEIFENHHFQNCNTSSSVKELLYATLTNAPTLYNICKRVSHPGLGVFVVRSIKKEFLITLYSEAGHIVTDTVKDITLVDTYIDNRISKYTVEKNSTHSLKTNKNWKASKDVKHFVSLNGEVSIPFCYFTNSKSQIFGSYSKLSPFQIEYLKTISQSSDFAFFVLTNSKGSLTISSDLSKKLLTVRYYTLTGTQYYYKIGKNAVIDTRIIESNSILVSNPQVYISRCNV